MITLSRLLQYLYADSRKLLVFFLPFSTSFKCHASGCCILCFAIQVAQVSLPADRDEPRKNTPVLLPDKCKAESRDSRPELAAVYERDRHGALDTLPDFRRSTSREE